MGKLSKSLGLDKKGKITVSLDKRSYYSGDVISGTIQVTVFQPIQCDALVVKVSGKEWMSWTEQQQNNSQRRSKKVKVHSEKIVVHAYAQMLAPGDYSYPFTYRVPVGLPGSFELQDYGSPWAKAVNAGISYSLKATLDVGGFLARDIKAAMRLLIREPVPENEPEIKAAVTKNVRFLLCASKGECALSVHMEYNAYHPGETANVTCVVRNDSEVEIRAIRYRLFQDVTLHTGFNIWNAPLTQTVVTCQFHGVGANKTVTNRHAVPMCGPANYPRPWPTSSRGKMVQCTYRMEVECDIQWCPDVAVKFPLRLF